MDFEIYLPCQPDWLCESFLSVFTILLIIGLVAFIRIIYREYLTIKRKTKVRKLRNTHRKDRYKIRNSTSRR
ncbi:hypothetical protein D8T51_20125 [Vibrio vulnificus]|jgi:uncharacterized membrane protein YcjF (UPF0283 family)|uniref:Uncharacterized protein n=1 Tax=Vibrio vulnificus TaxID=672 RepID=A0A087IKE2_VIBVL|nr:MULTISPECIES: hypothetical protein [Vibrio]ASC56943.1 hypothetical protein FORC37_1249 [Vibrio vulnificus]ASJ38789.1 hypothetical protein VVCECT4999_08805 [Vibrio vulnificus]ASM95109.1 hypothetical protein AOT11_07495 [Vibrio vulnificus NBRC 15645 = ATCC 27562]AUL95413.1 hypothetical protein FORC54_1268 [Vibrio vulnificus]AVW99267.1 hypothetical protein BJD94_04725 [Vibrio vulnificus Env1]